MSGNTPNDQPRPSRWKLYFSLTFLALAGAAGTVAWIEIFLHNNFTARCFQALQSTKICGWEKSTNAKFADFKASTNN